MVREQRVPFGGVSDGVVTAGTDEGGVDRTVDLPNVIVVYSGYGGALDLRGMAENDYHACEWPGRSCAAAQRTLPAKKASRLSRPNRLAWGVAHAGRWPVRKSLAEPRLM